jgi:hypothetical protein
VVESAAYNRRTVERERERQTERERERQRDRETAIL